MKPAYRKPGALGVVMGILAGMVVGMGVMVRDAGAHAELTWAEVFNHYFRGRNTHLPGKPVFQISDITHNTVVISWPEVHHHRRDRTTMVKEEEAYKYWISIKTSQFSQYRDSRTGRVRLSLHDHCIDRIDRSRPNNYSSRSPLPEGCIRRDVPAGRSKYSITIPGLAPETTYYLNVTVTTLYSVEEGNVPQGEFFNDWVAGRVTHFKTTAAPPEPETPTTPEPETPTEPEPETPEPETPEPETPEPETPEPETPTEPEPENPTSPEPETPNTPEPETPTEPETPDPTSQSCTYKHRLTGVPGTTGSGYTSQILISSEASNATATIRAYQSDNGHQIDVLDSEGSAIGSTTSLAPAHSVKQFRLEGARGWHSVIVEHPSKAAMDSATVAMRIREPDTGIEIEHVQGIEHCTTTATTTE